MFEILSDQESALANSVSTRALFTSIETTGHTLYVKLDSDLAFSVILWLDFMQNRNC